MSGTSVDDFFSQQAQEARGPEPRRPARRKPRRSRGKRIRRIAGASVLAIAVVGGAVAGGGYLAVNHLASSVQRIQGVAALDAANQPVMPTATRKSMTVLLTSSASPPAPNGGGGVLGSSAQPEALSGLIALVHLNADGSRGAVVSIPSNAVVTVPGHGRLQLWDTLAVGGPSLLIRTVEDLTDVRISHYSVLDFAGVANVIHAMNGVNVDVPYATSNGGFNFHAGINHLSSRSVLAYARQPAVSEIIRAELQQNLIRAMLDKIAHKRMFTHVATDYRVLHAMSRVLSVDSNFSDSQLESLALRLGDLRSGDGTFITAPAAGSPATGPVYLDRAITRKLWAAVRNDAVASFASRYPSTVTPIAPG